MQPLCIEVASLEDGKRQAIRLAAARLKKIYVVRCTGKVCNIANCPKGCIALVEGSLLGTTGLGKTLYDSTGRTY